MKTLSRSLSKTICPLPFLHTYIKANGAAVACCEAQETALSDCGEAFSTFWNNSAYKHLRKQLVAGERPALCAKCWKNEDIGAESNRQNAWTLLEHGFFGDTSIEINNDYEVSGPPVFLELKCNNVCNLKCRMCHPNSSFRVLEDYEIIQKFRGNIRRTNQPQSSAVTVEKMFSDNDNSSLGIKVFQFSGGEPLISKEHLYVLNYLLKRNPEKIHLRYSTNLTQLMFEKYHYPDLWRHFEKVNIKVSADGVFDVFDYIRTGAKFEAVISNFKKLIDLNFPNIHFSIGFTTQAYNVFQLPEFMEFFKNWVMPGAISSPLLFTPELLSVAALPPEIRHRVLNKMNQFSLDLPHVTNALKGSHFAPELWQKLQSYTNAMEQKHSTKNGFSSLMQKYLEGF